VTWELFQRGEAMPYPGGRAALLEFPYDSIPVRVEVRLWRLKKLGITPVLAHPERYNAFSRPSERLDDVVGAGAKLLLDVMSLTGTYGRAAQGAAERMLREGRYTAACSDAHKPADADRVAEALSVLQRSVGDDGLRQLLIEGPQRLLEGRDA
jgi:protein-tyrosine phosphatase